MFSVGALMSLSLLLMGGSIYFSSMRLAEKQALGLLLERQEDYSDEIISVLKNSKSNLLTFAEIPAVEATLRTNQDGGIEPVSTEGAKICASGLNQVVRAFLANYPNYLSLALLDTDGTVLAGVLHSAADQEVLQLEDGYRHLQEAMSLADKAVYYSDIKHQQADGLPILTVSTPIYIDGQLEGVAVAEISALPLLKSAIEKRKGIDTYIVDDKGKFWVGPNESTDFGAYFLTNESQQNEYVLINEKRNSVLAVHKILFDEQNPQRYWGVIHELPKSVVFKHLDQARDSMLITGLMIVLLAVFFASMLVSRIIINPIVRLVEGSRAVGDRNFSVRLDETSVDNEFKELFQAFNEYTEHSEAMLKEMKKRADSSAKSLENVVVHMEDALIVMNEFGIIKSCNPAVISLFGYTPKEIVGNNINLLIPELFKEERERLNADHKKKGDLKGIEHNGEVVGRRKSGSVFPMGLSINEYRVNEEQHFIGIFRDITVKKAMELEIQQTDERLKKHYNSYLLLSDFVRRASTNFEEACNKILQECAEVLQADWVGLWLFNNKRDALLCHNYYSGREKSYFTLPSLLVSEHEYYFSELLMEGGVLSNETTPLLSHFPEQAHSPVSILQLPVTKYKSIAGVFNVVNQDEARELRSDETQYVKSLSMLVEVLLEEESRRRVQEQLKKKNKELELASKMKSQFLSNMSHELRTPLNAIIGFSELLKGGVLGPLTEEQNQYSTEIFDSGSHLLDLINGILDLSKIEAGKEQLVLDGVSIQLLLQNTVYMLRDKASASGISMTEELDEKVTVCLLDERKTKQIVINLLSNAVKFTPKGGSIVISATIDKVLHPDYRLDDSELAQCETPYLKLSVSDTGIGISEENIDKLFRRFEQIDGSLAREFEGTGLGLSLVKAMTELHGGFVTVVSTLGEGSTFSVYLPYKEVDLEADYLV